MSLLDKKQESFINLLFLSSGLALVSSASAADLNFDLGSLQGTVMGILTVGVALVISFTIFKLGKRASRMI